jgi:hypothetical protein
MKADEVEKMNQDADVSGHDPQIQRAEERTGRVEMQTRSRIRRAGLLTRNQTAKTTSMSSMERLYRNEKE